MNAVRICDHSVFRNFRDKHASRQYFYSMKSIAFAVLVVILSGAVSAQQKFGDRYRDPPLYGKLETIYL